MHYTAMMHAQLFFDTYALPADRPRVLDVGSQDVNGSLRQVAPANAEYIGADFATGKGVDVVLTDPYSLPFEDESFDVVVSSSCFEHAEFFWLAFNEIMRVLKPHGLFPLNAPSNGSFHRYPVDCWRFYPDAAVALANWARRSGYDPKVLECFTGRQEYAGWNDYVAVFVKAKSEAARYPDRIVKRFSRFTNGMVDESDQVLNHMRAPEDKRRMPLPKVLRRLFYKRGLPPTRRA
jgi:SAM-dependent methyltransferase